jgi:hypothetical protein
MLLHGEWWRIPSLQWLPALPELELLLSLLSSSNVLLLLLLLR